MDDDAKQLLANFAESREPSEAQRLDAWAAISGRIALGDPGPLAANEPVTGLSTMAKVGLAIATTTAITLAVLGVMHSGSSAGNVGPMLRSPVVVASASSPEPAEPAAPRPVEPKLVEPKTAEAEPKPEVAPPRTKEPPPRRHRPEASSEPSPATSIPSSSLAEEMKLLRRASSQLNAGQPGRALDTLAEHAKRFPKGALTAEREIRRAEALCQRGDATGSKQVVDAFLRAHPGTALRRRAMSICAGVSNGTSKEDP